MLDQMFFADSAVHLHRFDKGGGPQADPSLMEDWSFWAVQSDVDTYLANLREAGSLADSENTVCTRGRIYLQF